MDSRLEFLISTIVSSTHGMNTQTRISSLFPGSGYNVYAGARRVDRMQPLADAGARLLSLDVTADTSMPIAVKTILQEAGRIDVLINNAGDGAKAILFLRRILSDRAFDATMRMAERQTTKSFA